MADKLFSALGARAAVLTTDITALLPAAGPPAEQATIAQLITLLNSINGTGPYLPLAGGTMTGLLQFSGTGHFGLRLNNLTTVQRDAIGVGSAGNAIWNTTTSRLDFNIGGSWKNFVRLDGDTMVGSLLFTDNSFDIGAAGATSPRSGFFGTSLFVGGTTTTGLLGHRTFGAISFSSDGVWALRDNATTSFGRLQFGGTTSAFPALKRSGNILQVRLADDAAYGTLEVNTLRTATAYTVAALPAVGSPGRRAYVTNALAPAYGANVAGGGAVVTPVFDNGTNWIVG